MNIRELRDAFIKHHGRRAYLRHVIPGLRAWRHRLIRAMKQPT